MTIQEAWKELLEIRGDRVTCLTIDLWQYNTGEQKQAVSLWDGVKLHEAKNLTALLEIAKALDAPKEPVDGELPEAIERKEGGGK